MDWWKLFEYSIAVSVAVGAKREMGAFRAMFKETLDKLAATQEAHGKDIADLKAQSKQTNEAVVGLASVVASAFVDDDDEDVGTGDGGGEPGQIN